ncbi:hypothetical protein DNTS_014554 [Danionella cerebrum]|uniref:C2 domain-containing protein n=1 Tax=Danionella cerebrum TaxID=2873325 RepID=A0A553MPZ6_9TELE|nr:hypothetical protein DNTS_014554 [Danionella translucida]
MESSLDMEESSSQLHPQHQRSLWRSFQIKPKPPENAKLGKKERKQENGFWVFKKKRGHGLNRALSTSQPNLSCEAPESEGDSSRRSRFGKPEMGAHAPPARAESLAAEIQRLRRTVSSKNLLSLRPHTRDKAAVQGSDATKLQTDEEPLDKSLGVNEVGNGGGTTSLYLFQLEIVLKRGNSLAIRDRGGTSDPYVKIKISGKEVYRSKIIHKNLNPIWNEHVCLIVDNLQEPLYLKDDFMGSAYLHLQSLQQRRAEDVVLALKDPQCPSQDLGSLELTVTLYPRSSEDRDLLRQNQHQDSHALHPLRQAHLWRGIVSITLLEGQNLIPMDQNGFSDPYVKFRLGSQKYRSKTIPKSLNPQWREQFDLRLSDEEDEMLLEISVWDKDIGRRDDFIGQCAVDLRPFSRERTHKLKLELTEGKGMLVLLITLTACKNTLSESSLNLLEDSTQRESVRKRYVNLKSFSNLKDVGLVQVKILRAEGLMAADLCNERLQTHTVYKTLNPDHVKDIHSVLEITVYDEDKDRSADFLGKVSIPLLRICSREQKSYVLKNKTLTAPTKGVMVLQADVIFNAVKASLQTFVPPEMKYVEEEPKVSKQLLEQNFNRVKRCVLFLMSLASFISSCFQWESRRRSLCAFLVFVLAVWNFEIFMLPLLLLLLLTWNYFRGGKEMFEGSVQDMEDLLENVNEDNDKDDKDSEKIGFLEKLHAFQHVIITVQNTLDEVACFGERVKNTFNWSVPFLSWLAVAVLCATAMLTYLIPLRYIVLIWGINKFTKKLRNPYNIENNELLDFLSRVPSDVQMVQYKELKPEAAQSPSKKWRNNP